jgi:signal transduction histidine kinase
VAGERLPRRAEDDARQTDRRQPWAWRNPLGGDEVTVLRGLSHALASTPSHQELGSALTAWVEAALGTQPAETRILVRDARGKARQVRSESRTVLRQKRLRYRIRRRALRTKHPLSATLHDGLGFAVLPMVSRGEAFGAVEVAAPEAAMVERWSTLEAVASQGAIALRHISQASELQGAARRMGALVTLSRDLLAASSPEAAIQEAVNFLHAEFGTAVAAWFAPEGSQRLGFVGAVGVEAGTRRRLRRWSPSRIASDRQGTELADRFAGLVGATGVEALDLRDGILVMGSSSAEAQQTLAAVGPVLNQAIALHSDVASARLRNEHLDLGLAWTAHELRSPLVGLRALLDLESSSAAAAEDLGDLRAAAMRDLTGLLQQVEDLLRWAVGGGPLRKKPSDLVRLVREAVAASSADEPTGRVVVQGPPALQVGAEPAELRRAIANVIRNALAYSPRGEPVKVSMSSSDGVTAIKVVDRGPGVSSQEAREIFDPLARGQASRRRRSGHGLGLFIARRIVEAHDGSIRVDPRPHGATFIIELPAGLPDRSPA